MMDKYKEVKYLQDNGVWPGEKRPQWVIDLDKKYFPDNVNDFMIFRVAAEEKIAELENTIKNLNNDTSGKSGKLKQRLNLHEEVISKLQEEVKKLTQELSPRLCKRCGGAIIGTGKVEMCGYPICECDSDAILGERIPRDWRSTMDTNLEKELKKELKKEMEVPFVPIPLRMSQYQELLDRIKALEEICISYSEQHNFNKFCDCLICKKARKLELGLKTNNQELLEDKARAWDWVVDEFRKIGMKDEYLVGYQTLIAEFLHDLKCPSIKN